MGKVLDGVPRVVERPLVRRYGASPARRVGLAALVKALAVLVRRHPRAALDAAAAGLVHAGRVGMRGLSDRLREPPPPSPAPARRLSRRERRRFVRLLSAGADAADR